MYVKTTVTLEDLQGNEDDYEVGADVDVSYDNYGGKERPCGYDVGEPDISAPGCKLKDSRVANPEVFVSGWSTRVEEALVEAYEGWLEAKYEESWDYPEPYDD